MSEQHFKSGFAVLAGLPNAGKSTLLNQLAGGLLSAVTHKPQTTRQNILAISQGDNYQVVYVDTPGFLIPKYKLQQTMSDCVDRAVREDADVVLFMVDATADFADNEKLIAKLKTLFCPIFLVLNKVDLVQDHTVLEALETCAKDQLPIQKTFRISAAKGTGLEPLKQAVVDAMPNSPAYFPPDQWTDRWERFYAAEFIREQIFLLYQQEIPYSTYVEIEKFAENLGPKNFIRANIHVERESQKPILIGKGGSMIAKLRERSQKRIEEFLGKKFRVELNVVVSPDWRNSKTFLEQFGYIDKDPREV
ncbi:MAG: GTPase Era [Elusimicrobiaceae bacterium]|nr:GTPase Era [Elusimicrobiaceae bacterium]